MPPTSTSSSPSAPPLLSLFSPKSQFSSKTLPTRGGRPISAAPSIGVSTQQHHPRKNRNKKIGGRERRQGGVGFSEEEDLVQFLLSKSDGDDRKTPLVTTLNKYVKVIRTEHCFLLSRLLAERTIGYNALRCSDGCRNRDVM